MAQQRLFEFEAPDSTFDLNSRFSTIAPAGLYYGFDAVRGASMNLGFNHLTTGLNYVNDNLSLTDKLGVVITKQGVEIRIGTVASLPINPTAGVTRKDAVILEHGYVLSTGGNPASISVLENVTLPLTLASNQVLLGILELPINCTALNQTGVVYTRSVKPNFSNNDDLKTQLEAEITARQDADTVLQGNIDDEAVARQDADTAIQTDIDSLNTAVSQKIDATEKGAVNGVATLGAGGKIPAIQIPDEYRESKVVNNIAERNALTPVFDGLKCHVIDATDDVTVASGSAGYIYQLSSTSWIKTYESESLDLSLANYYTKAESVDRFKKVISLGSNYDFNAAYSANAEPTEWGINNYVIIIDTPNTFNSPPALFGTAWLLETIRIDTDRVMQVATDMDYSTQPFKWYRHKSYTNSGNWTPWFRFATGGFTGSWATIPFLDAVVNVGSGNFDYFLANVNYRKDQFGIVHLEGTYAVSVSSASSGSVFTVRLQLPAGFRPIGRIIVPEDNLDYSGFFLRSRIDSDGTVLMRFDMPSGGGPTEFRFHFTGISYNGN